MLLHNDSSSSSGNECFAADMQSGAAKLAKFQATEVAAHGKHGPGPYHKRTAASPPKKTKRRKKKLQTRTRQSPREDLVHHSSTLPTNTWPRHALNPIKDRIQVLMERLNRLKISLAALDSHSPTPDGVAEYFMDAEDIAKEIPFLASEYADIVDGVLMDYSLENVDDFYDFIEMVRMNSGLYDFLGGVSTIASKCLQEEEKVHRKCLEHGPTVWWECWSMQAVELHERDMMMHEESIWMETISMASALDLQKIKTEAKRQKKRASKETHTKKAHPRTQTIPSYHLDALTSHDPAPKKPMSAQETIPSYHLDALTSHDPKPKKPMSAKQTFYASIPAAPKPPLASADPVVMGVQTRDLRSEQGPKPANAEPATSKPASEPAASGKADGSSEMGHLQVVVQEDGFEPIPSPVPSPLSQAGYQNLRKNILQRLALEDEEEKARVRHVVEILAEMPLLDGWVAAEMAKRKYLEAHESHDFCGLVSLHRRFLDTHAIQIQRVWRGWCGRKKARAAAKKREEEELLEEWENERKLLEEEQGPPERTPSKTDMAHEPDPFWGAVTIKNFQKLPPQKLGPHPHPPTPTHTHPHPPTHIHPTTLNHIHHHRVTPKYERILPNSTPNPTQDRPIILNIPPQRAPRGTPNPKPSPSHPPSKLPIPSTVRPSTTQSAPHPTYHPTSTPSHPPPSIPSTARPSTTQSHAPHPSHPTHHPTPSHPMKSSLPYVTTPQGPPENGPFGTPSHPHPHHHPMAHAKHPHIRAAPHTLSYSLAAELDDDFHWDGGMAMPQSWDTAKSGSVDAHVFSYGHGHTPMYTPTTPHYQYQNAAYPAPRPPGHGRSHGRGHYHFPPQPLYGSGPTLDEEDFDFPEPFPLPSSAPAPMTRTFSPIPMPPKTATSKSKSGHAKNHPTPTHAKNDPTPNPTPTRPKSTIVLF